MFVLNAAAGRSRRTYASSSLPNGCAQVATVKLFVSFLKYGLLLSYTFPVQLFTVPTQTLRAI
jgi:hypothetical protein